MATLYRYEMAAMIRCNCGEVGIVRFQNINDICRSKCRFCDGHLFITKEQANRFLRDFRKDTKHLQTA
jgi:hypothetical protein